MRLSAGTPPGCGILLFPVVVFLALVEALIGWIAVDQTRRFVTGGDFGPGQSLAFAGLAVIMGILLYCVGAMVWVYLRVASERVWLKGPRLVERGVVLRRRVDLRSARLELTAGTDDVQLLLTATDPRSGRSVRLPVQTGRRYLPAPELTALAEAIRDEPGLLRRAGPDQEAALAVAGRLRELAVVTTGEEAPTSR